MFANQFDILVFFVTAFHTILPRFDNLTLKGFLKLSCLVAACHRLEKLTPATSKWLQNGLGSDFSKDSSKNGEEIQHKQQDLTSLTSFLKR